MSDPRIRTIKIKSGVVKRYAKEKVMYENEAIRERSRFDKFKSEGKDEYDLRKQEEVVQESLMMVPDCQRRLQKAYEELNQILNSEKDLRETSEFVSAVKILEEAKPQLPASN